MENREEKFESGYVPGKENIEEGALENFDIEKSEKGIELSQSKEKIREYIDKAKRSIEEKGDENIVAEQKEREYLIKNFIELTFIKGEGELEKIIKEIQKYNDPFLLDEFHDRLMKEINQRTIDI